MQRNTRKQTAAEKRQADRELARNGALALRNFIAKFPDDKWNADRERQAAMLESKLQTMGA